MEEIIREKSLASDNPELMYKIKKRGRKRKMVRRRKRRRRR